MRRLTMSVDACVETLSLLITMAWADGRLDDAERAGVLGAAEVLNLTKELREKLDVVLAKPMPVELVLFESLSPKDRSFAYVAAAWMAGADEDVDPKEEAVLDQLATSLALSPVDKARLERIARDLEPPVDGKRNWSREIERLFRAIPAKLDGAVDEEIEVVFE